ncbi:predicted protein [Naegleria gruberi]|uniref:Predicted protein n=1 Tax=Naegleria gruberi TaxID=5762 RepID=D2W1L2_NAEGR|nr:uncharacterized protein NAEGRDRAFT_75261 [Naegleria gruberi]EFC37064.1 predicted protein [Naegleria gruberi]|eukprot:XP_002669808.1 predicted protein [Naegleria gruberi strain NEG-M]
MSSARAGKVRRSTPFIPSKHITLPEVNRRQKVLPPNEYTSLCTKLYDNQLNRKKEKNGRSKMRSQFNKYSTEQQQQQQDEVISYGGNDWEFSEASFYSLAYPRIQEESDYTIYRAPLVGSSVNSMQRQFFNAQSSKLRRLRTDANRKKRRLERRGRKLFTRKLRTLRSAPPLFTAPKPNASILGNNRMASVTSMGLYYSSGRVH